MNLKNMTKLTDDDRRTLFDAASTLEDAERAIRDATALGCDPLAMATALRAMIGREPVAATPLPRRLVNPDFTATQEGHDQDGYNIMHRWERLCREFVAALPSDADLTDVMHLCGTQLTTELHRRIIRERRAKLSTV